MTRQLLLALLGPALFAAPGCESNGSLGDSPVEQCVPSGQCDQALFELGIVASRGDAQRGRTVFATSCARCHGQDGHGLADARRVDMTSPAWQARLRDGEITRIVLAGRPPVMPSFRLGDAQLCDLLAYVRGLEGHPTPAPKPTY